MLIGAIVLYIFLAGLVGAYASRKKMGFIGGFLFSVVLTPIIGLIIVHLSSDKENIEEEAAKESWKVYRKEARQLEGNGNRKEALKKYEEALYHFRKREQLTEKLLPENEATEIEKKITELKGSLPQV
ncbi:MAG TPA: hypothetical protein VJ949_08755 [Cryomorphaceae bacterium]|nr:hypothetical protein [Cryomorphaceae bacterium]